MIDIWDFSLLRILFRICQEQDTQKKIYEQRKQRQQYWISQFFLISLSTTIERVAALEKSKFELLVTKTRVDEEWKERQSREEKV